MTAIPEHLRTELVERIADHFAQLPPIPADSCPLSVPLFGADEVWAVLEALLTQEVTMGRRVREFEDAFARYIGSEHAIMVNSGSSANLLAMAVLTSEAVPNGLRPGDEIIVPAVTWSTTVWPILQLGCVPVLVDVDVDTLNLRPELLEEAMSPRTRGIFCVHLLGNPMDMTPVMDFAREHDLWVIEDTCESLGSSFDGRKVGSFGAFGTYSFYFSHHMTTIEGGMVVTDDAKLADVARSMRAHGWTRDMSNRAELEAANPEIDPRFLFVMTGYNLRPTDLQGAFGLVQLPQLEGFNEARRANAQYLLERLRPLSDDVTFVTETPNGRSTWFGFAMLARDAELQQRLKDHLERHRIDTRPIVAGNLAVQPGFRNNPHRVAGDLTGANAIGERGLFIGNHPALTTAHLDHVVGVFEGFFGH